MDGRTPTKRRRVNRRHPNPLFEQWLAQWRDEAHQQGLQARFSYARALESLRKYPLVMQSGRECAILKNFGKNLCDKLDRKLARHKIANPDFAAGLDAGVGPSAPTTAASATTNGAVASTSGANGTVAPKSPKKRTMAASSTNNGTDVARSPGKQRSKKKNAEFAVCPAVRVNITAGNVQVKLLVDTGETTANCRKPSKKQALKELETQSIVFETRKLSVGDFLWVATDGEHELVLPVIVERKRLDDFAQSIKQGRYHEQKWRLKATGFQVIYLIESMNVRTGLPLETLCQAETNTELNDKFCVHKTYGVKETVTYLSTMTKVLQKRFQDKSLQSVMAEEQPIYGMSNATLRLFTFSEFSVGSAKIENFTVREMFAVQLMQVSGASVETVCAIVDKFPTPALLRRAFLSCSSSEECMQQITSIKLGVQHKFVAPEVARRIHLLYTKHDFHQH